MKSRLVQNGAAIAIGALLAFAATVSVTISARLNDQHRTSNLADSTRFAAVVAFENLEELGASLIASSTPVAPEIALERFAGAEQARQDKKLLLQVEAVVELSSRGGPLEPSRLASATATLGDGDPIGGAAEALADALAGWRPSDSVVATARDASGDGAIWAVWSRRDGGRMLAALVRPTLGRDAAASGAHIQATTYAIDASPLPQAADDIPDSLALTRLGDRIIALRFTSPTHGAFDHAVSDAAPFLVIIALLAIAVVVLMRAQKANLALFDARQQEIIGNIAANQRALEASEERFRHLAESTNVIPWTADLDRQRFTYVGPQIEDLSGYPASTWQASGFWLQHIHPADRQRVIGETLRNAEDGRYVTVEYRIRAADGRTLHIRNMLAITRIRRQGAKGPVTQTIAQGFMLDVTEMKRAATALELARAKAEEANRVKSEFLASMSHELRTPLNAVIGFSEIMKDEVFGPLDPRYREYAESVYSSGRHLLDLINDVLDLSKIEAGRIELAEEPTDLGALMEDCRTLLQERMQSAGVHCRCDIAEDMPLVMVDERRIKQVLLNLMSNAIKFTPPGGSVAFIARFVPERGVLLAVRDTGIGMAPDEIPKALSKFGQIDGELSRKHDGTGLGLPIAKSLIEMHGGALEIDSEKGKGTEIRVWLPKDRLSEAA